MMVAVPRLLAALLVCITVFGAAWALATNHVPPLYIPLVADGQPTATPVPTATSEPSPTPRPAQVRIVDIVLFDPAFPNSSEEYVQIRNVGNQSVTLTGWRLLNTSRPDATRSVVPAFIFPAYTLDVDVTVAVFSADGAPDFELSNFYWGQQGVLWKAGDRAELRDAQNNLVHTFTVSSDQ